jgi:hypothetical protein
MPNCRLAFWAEGGGQLSEQATRDSSIWAPAFAAGTVSLVALLPPDMWAGFSPVEAIHTHDGVVRWGRPFHTDKIGADPPPAPLLDTQTGTWLAILGDRLAVLHNCDGKLLGTWCRAAFPGGSS